MNIKTMIQKNSIIANKNNITLEITVLKNIISQKITIIILLFK